MSSLSQVIEQIKLEIQVDCEGRGKASIRAVARLAGVDDESIRKSLIVDAEQSLTKLAQKLTNSGFEVADLNRWRADGIPDLAIAVIVEYYSFDAGRYCNEQSRLCYKAFASIGIRCWMQDIVGYKRESKPVSTADLLVQMALAYKEHEVRLNAIEEENINLKKQLAEIQENQEVIELETQANTCELERFRNGHGYWYSIIGFAAKHGIKDISVSDARRLGRKASSLCRLSGITPQKINDPRYGNVGSYPQHILEELIFGQPISA